MKQIRRILVANRGEIAVRIIRTARSMGIETVAAHSECDAGSLSVRLADGSALLGPAPAAQSYLRAEKIVAAALATGCQAVHPGYGFLSEREELARAVEEAGLVYIGPTPENIRRLGDKLEARRALSAAGIPVVPGRSEPIRDIESLRALATKTGYPLLLKAASGGGGKGIRLVRAESELESAFRVAASEAKGAFGEGAIFAERFLERARHVEVQVVGDGRGGVQVFPERDCSLQRRYQKLVEETPCPAVGHAVRGALLETAAQIAGLARYRGAGTIEFLLAPGGSFHFLEMNTRLQVEHPITEMVTGADLVREQIEVAAGKTYPGAKPLLREARGAAVELRINAEDPEENFRPSTGRITGLRLPGGPGVRVDSGLSIGIEVTPHYDALLAKVIAWGEDRAAAIERLRAACLEMRIEGVATTLALAAPLLADPAFRSGDYHCQHLEALLARPDFFARDLDAGDRAALAIVAAFLRSSGSRAECLPASDKKKSAPRGSEGAGDSPWAALGRGMGLRGGER